MKKSISIYQPIIGETDESQRRYSSFIVRCYLGEEIIQGAFDSLYSKAYEGKVDVCDLEEIFRLFNDNRPRGYYYGDMRSMSVGDVLLYDNVVYQVMACGFKEVELRTSYLDSIAEE